MRKSFAMFFLGMLVFSSSLETRAQILPGQERVVGVPTIANSQFAKRDHNARMIINAKEVIYNNDNKTVTAIGAVQIYYDNRTLEADKVIYNRETERVRAIGKVRITEITGNVLTADELELDKDFSNGFINAVNAQTPDRIHVGANSAVREAGDKTTYYKTTYTPCEKCETNPNRAPVWQIKASKVIHKDKERVFYFYDARLEVFGVPVLYIPYAFAPDFSRKRQTGFLAPSAYSSNLLGYGFEQPFYYEIAPNHDATVGLTYYTKQGTLLKGEHRYGFEHGHITTRFAGIDQQNKAAFSNNSGAFPYFEAPGNRGWRGYAHVQGEFKLSDKWTMGMSLYAMSDRLFIGQYNMNSIAAPAQSEANSTVYLTGHGEKSYFDLRAVRYTGLVTSDRQSEIPTTIQADYFKTSKNAFWGGEVTYKGNFLSLSRDQADFDPRTNRTLFDPLYARAYDGCDSMTAGAVVPTSNSRADCILKGIAGTYTRASFEANWRKRLITTNGQVFEPFAGLRGDIAALALRPNQDVYNYFGNNFSGTTAITRFTPTLGMTYRYPFVMKNSSGLYTIEPISQLVLRPSENAIGRLPNEDAQSLVFDDSNLFSTNKFSGWDRVEGGGRLNYGLQTSALLSNGFYVNMLFGQSLHMFGLNSFTYGDHNHPSGNLDMAATGANSGLDKARSDYVARVHLKPSVNYSLLARMRFDEKNFALKRLEVDASAQFGRFSGTVTYARFAERPLLGFNAPKEGIGGAVAYRFDNNWTIFGSARHAIDLNRIDHITAGLSYLDECFQFTSFYARQYYYPAALSAPNPPDEHRFMTKLSFRTLGDVAAAIERIF